MSNWQIYAGHGKQHDGIKNLPPPPEWRTFGLEPKCLPKADHRAEWNSSDIVRGSAYRADPRTLNSINAAMYLRRPLLVTGNPGVGKSTLAYSMAWELGLRDVLRWPITSSSMLKDGLYQYDAMGRLQDVNLREGTPQVPIGKYLRLGPLGTAFLPADTPRVLLIDEIDKAGLDLPNDLLSIFEDGRYEIEELIRVAESEPEHMIRGADGKQTKIVNGEVRCSQFPIVIMTSNGEREFPPAFLRRCVRLNINPPSREQLAWMVGAQMGEKMIEQANEVITRYEQVAQEGVMLANDQLLNAIHLTCRTDLDPDERSELIALLFRSLTTELSRPGGS